VIERDDGTIVVASKSSIMSKWRAIDPVDGTSSPLARIRNIYPCVDAVYSLTKVSANLLGYCGTIGWLEWDEKTGTQHFSSVDRCKVMLPIVSDDPEIVFIVGEETRAVLAGHQKWGVPKWTIVPFRSYLGHSAAVNSICELRLPSRNISECDDDDQERKETTLIATGSEDKTIRLWDYETGDCMWTLTGHAATVNCLTSVKRRISNKLNNRITTTVTLVSGSIDGVIKLWNVEQGLCISTLIGHSAPISSLVELRVDDLLMTDQLASDGLVASGSYDGRVCVWSLAEGCCLARCVSSQAAGVTSLVQTRDGSLIAGLESGYIDVFCPPFS